MCLQAFVKEANSSWGAFVLATSSFCAWHLGVRGQRRERRERREATANPSVDELPGIADPEHLRAWISDG